MILHLIGKIGTAGGTGFVFEYAGKVINNFSMEERMTVCNMSIEAGARAGLIAPDNKTFEYLKDKPLSPKGKNWDIAVKYWKTLKSDENAKFDKKIIIDASSIEPQVTWGTSPEDVVSINSNVPDPSKIKNIDKRQSAERALNYMGLEPGQKMNDINIDTVFIGSCTNGRIEDLRKAAKILEGRKVDTKVKAFVVPGSGLVKKQAEKEGLDKIFLSSGFEWREPGCSMCLAMNSDKLQPNERCASTSNRNFEGRQGRGGRTHLLSPEMAVAAAIKELFDVGNYKMEKFSKLSGIVASIELSNIDTDMIIPKQFLKTIKRSGLGKGLFYEMRFDQSENKIPEFILNKKPYDKSKILVALENFGCGSSREHAPWALTDFE